MILHGLLFFGLWTHYGFAAYCRDCNKLVAQLFDENGKLIATGKDANNAKGVIVVNIPGLGPIWKELRCKNCFDKHKLK